jgi:hypothetical protein
MEFGSFYARIAKAFKTTDECRSSIHGISSEIWLRGKFYPELTEIIRI